MSETKAITGGCMCGAVRFAIAASEPMMAGQCHCRHCQKLSGSGHTVFAVFHEKDITKTGDLSEYHYTADSGSDVSLSFCKGCGTPLFGRPSRFGGITGVRASALDDPSIVKPAFAVYTACCQPWDSIPEGLDQFEAMVPDPPPPS